MPRRRHSGSTIVCQVYPYLHKNLGGSEILARISMLPKFTILNSGKVRDFVLVDSILVHLLTLRWLFSGIGGVGSDSIKHFHTFYKLGSPFGGYLPGVFGIRKLI